MSDLLITHISLGERAVEIGYNEARDRGEKCMMFRTIMVEREFCENQLAELVELAQDIIDKGLDILLNPPDTIPARERPDYR